MGRECHAYGYWMTKHAFEEGILIKFPLIGSHNVLFTHRRPKDKLYAA